MMNQTSIAVECKLVSRVMLALMTALCISFPRHSRAGAQAEDHGDHLSIRNEFLNIHVERSGGRISRFEFKPARTDFTWWGFYHGGLHYEPGGGLLELNFWDRGPMLPEFRLADCRWEILESGPEQAVIEVFNRGAGPLHDLEVGKRIMLRRDDPVLESTWKFMNTNVGGGHTITIGPVFRSSLRPGDADGSQKARASTFYIPTTRGVETVAYDPDNPPETGRFRLESLARGWIGVADADGIGAVMLTDFRYLRGALGYLYLPQWPNLYWELQPLSVRSLETVEIPYLVFPFRGLTRIDGASVEAVGGIRFDGEAQAGQPLSVTVGLVSRHDRDVALEIEHRVLPHEERRVLQTREGLALTSGQVSETRIEYTPETEGTHVVHVTVRDTANRILLEMERPFVAGESSGDFTMEPEAAPLQMAALEPRELTGPPTEHIAWARPSDGGTVRALFVVPGYWARELIELRQRMDLEFDFVSSAMLKTRGSPVQIPPIGIAMGEEDLQLTEYLLTHRRYDVMVIRGVPYETFPLHLQQLIIDRVNDGMGLVYTPEHTPTPSGETLLSAQLFAGLTETRFGPVTVDPVDLLALQAVPAGTFGQGRVILGGNVYFTLTPRDFCFHLRFDYPYWEYWYANWIKVLQWAAGREPRLRIAAIADPTDQTAVTLSNRGDTELEANLVYHLLDDQDHRLAEGQLSSGPIPAGAERDLLLPLGPVRRDGRLRLHVFAHNQQGGLFDFGAVQSVRQGMVTDMTLSTAGVSEEDAVDFAAREFLDPDTIAELRLTTDRKRFRPDEPVVLVLDFEATEDAKADAHVRLYDAHERRVFEKVVPIAVRPGANRHHFRVTTEGGYGIYREARLSLHAQDQLLNTAVCDIILDFPRPEITDILPGGVGTELAEQPDYLWRFYNRRKWDMGIRMTGWGWWGWSERLFTRLGMRLFMMNAGSTRERDTREVYRGGNTIGHDIGENQRNFCFHNPAHMDAMFNALRIKFDFAGTSLYRGNLPFYALADEPGIMHALGDVRPTDLCFCDHSLAAFRDYLKGHYADIETLNREWETAYASFDDVMPLREDQLAEHRLLAPWLAFRMFMAETWAELFGQIETFIRELDGDPTVMAGFANLFGENPWNANSQYLFAGNITGLMSYSLYFDRGRSFFHHFDTPQPYKGYWTGYTHSTAPFDVWKLVLWGGAFPMLYYHTAEAPYGRAILQTDQGMARHGRPYGYCDAGGNPGAYFERPARVLQELHQGLGSALVTSRIPSSPVAVLISYEDHFAEHLIATDHGHRGYGAQPRHFGVSADIYNRIQDQGLTCDYVTPQQLEEGVPGYYQAVALTTIRFLSEAAIRALEAYVEAGGTVIAHHFAPDEFAVYTHHGGMRVDLTNRDRLVQAIVQAGHALENSLPAADVIVRPTGGNDPMAGFMYIPHEAGVLTYYGILRSAYSPEREALEVDVKREGFLYDVRQQEWLGQAPLRFAAAFPRQDAVVLALLPYRVEGVDLQVDYRPAQHALQYRVQIQTSEAAEIGHHTVRLELRAPDGETVDVYSRNLPTRNGMAEGVLRLAINDPAGEWTLVASELVTGKASSVNVRVVP